MFRSSKRVFSKNSISLGFKDFAAFVISLDLVSLINVILFGSISLSLSATILSDLDFLSSSVLILPKCDNKIIDAPLSKIYLMVGKAASILFISAILPSAIGTLKSTLKITFFPLRFKSLIDFFI